jgi:hypothetical protein
MAGAVTGFLPVFITTTTVFADPLHAHISGPPLVVDYTIRDCLLASLFTLKRSTLVITLIVASPTANVVKSGIVRIRGDLEMAHKVNTVFIN